MAQKDYTAERSDYRTPPEIYEPLLNIAGAKVFNIDVCCNLRNIPAKLHYIDGVKNGLVEPWRGQCFLNPPFSYAEKWVRKAVESVNRYSDTEVFAVLPADRFETKYYQECILNNSDCCFAFLPKKVGFIVPGHESEPIKPSQKIIVAIFSRRALEIVSDWNFYGWFNTVAFRGGMQG